MHPWIVRSLYNLRACDGSVSLLACCVPYLGLDFLPIYHDAPENQNVHSLIKKQEKVLYYMQENAWHFAYKVIKIAVVIKR